MQRGAARVYAIDVGTAQLDWKLRNDPRVVVQEQVNARYLTQAEVPEPIELAVCDVSFISITMILPALQESSCEKWRNGYSGKAPVRVGTRAGGQRRDYSRPSAAPQACQRVEDAVQRLGFQTDIIPSPVLGAEGNQEFLLYARH